MMTRAFNRLTLCTVRGFTLVELMIVVAVVAVLGVLAAPSLQSTMARVKLRGAAAEAYSDMQFARTEAVQRNANVTATFSATGYQITQGGTTLKAVTLEGGNSVSSGAAMVVTFNALRATAAVTGGPVVFASSATSGTVRLTVSILGRSEICSTDSLVGVVAC